MSRVRERRLRALENAQARRPAATFDLAPRALSDDDLDFLIAQYEGGWSRRQGVDVASPEDRSRLLGLSQFLEAKLPDELAGLSEVEVDDRIAELRAGIADGAREPEGAETESHVSQVRDAIVIAVVLGGYVSGEDPWLALYRGVAAAHHALDAVSPLRAPFHRRFAAAASDARLSTRRDKLATRDPALSQAFASILERHPDLNSEGRGPGYFYRGWACIDDAGQLRIDHLNADGGTLSDEPAAAMGIVTYLETQAPSR